MSFVLQAASWVVVGLHVIGCSGGAPPSNPTPLPPDRRTSLPDADDPFFAKLETPTSSEPYLKRLSDYTEDPAEPMEDKTMPASPEGAQLVHYESDGRRLPAWLLEPQQCEQKCPGVVYLHNDYSLTLLSYRNARPLVEAGFVVLIPTFRSENGNPGDFSLILGGVEDAKSAALWLSEQPSVEPQHLFAIGHSLGGGMAALLSLHDDVPLVLTASVGGIYRARTFSSWARRRGTKRLIHFDPLDQEAVSLRLLRPNLRDMRRPLIAYAGMENRFDRENAAHLVDEAREVNAPYSAEYVAGSHMGSIREAVEKFILVVKQHVENDG